MKILIVRMFPSVVNIDVYNLQEIGLAKAITKQGHKCDIVYYNENNEEKIEEYKLDNGLKINIYWLPGKDFFGNAIFSKRLLEIIQGYDIIQSSEYNQILNVKLYKILKNRLVIYHGPYYNKFNAKDNVKSYLFDIYINLFYRKYKNITIITKSKLAEEFVKKKGYKKVINIGVGIDEDRLLERDTDEKKYIKNDGKKVILYIGQIQERRNIIFLINVFAKVKASNKNTQLVIIGNGEEKYVNQCRKVIQSNNLNNDITIISEIKQSEIGNIYRKASVFLLATSYEIFGMVLLEAMFYGIPTITTYNGGASTLIENGVNGYICDKLNEEMWANRIIEILNSNDLKDITNNAKETIKNKFTWNKLAVKFLEIYDKNINN